MFKISGWHRWDCHLLRFGTDSTANFGAEGQDVERPCGGCGTCGVRNQTIVVAWMGIATFWSVSINFEKQPILHVDILIHSLWCLNHSLVMGSWFQFSESFFFVMWFCGLRRNGRSLPRAVWHLLCPQCVREVRRIWTLMHCIPWSIIFFLGLWTFVNSHYLIFLLRKWNKNKKHRLTLSACVWFHKIEMNRNAPVLVKQNTFQLCSRAYMSDFMFTI